jgi:hypothetical protein
VLCESRPHSEKRRGAGCVPGKMKCVNSYQITIGVTLVNINIPSIAVNPIWGIVQPIRQCPVGCNFAANEIGVCFAVVFGFQ